jgi:hypothetical protein
LDAALSSHLLDPGKRHEILASNEFVIELPPDDQAAQGRNLHRPIRERQFGRDLQSQGGRWRY